MSDQQFTSHSQPIEFRTYQRGLAEEFSSPLHMLFFFDVIHESCCSKQRETAKVKTSCSTRPDVAEREIGSTPDFHVRETLPVARFLHAFSGVKVASPPKRSMRCSDLAGVELVVLLQHVATRFRVGVVS